MKTACFSRQELEAFVPPNASVLICISDPESEYPHIQEGWEQVRFYQFWDASNPNSSHHGYPLPTEKQLRSIFDFINLYSDHNIFVSCEAGISRSGAIREYLFRRGWEPFDTAQKYRMVHPNSFILAELEKMFSTILIGEKDVA